MDKKQTFKAFVAACIGMAFFGVTMVALGSVLPALTEKLALTGPEMATLASVLTGGILIGSLVFGPVCDHYGHKGIFLASCIAVLLGLFGLSLVGSFTPLVGCYLLIGIGGGVLNGQTNTLASDLYGGDGGKLSLLGAFYGVGAVCITFLVYIADQRVPFETIIRVLSLVALLCIVYCFTVSFPEPKQAQSFPIKQAVQMLAQPVLLVMSCVLLLESSVETITNNLSTTYFGQQGLEGVVILLTVMMVALTLARFVLSVLSARMSQQAILYTFFAILFAGFALVSVARTMPMAMVAMALVGIGTAATYPVVLGRLGARFKQLSGTAFGIAITIALAGSTLLNALVGGLLLHIYPYVMMACVALMALLFFTGNRLLDSNDK